jgi:hypothetical protein
MDMISSHDAVPVAIRRGGIVEGGVRATLRLEGLVVLIAATAGFASLYGNWWLFAALFLAPDVSFLAYMINARIGAVAYNGLHTYIAPLSLGLVAYFTHAAFLLPIALIWIAHIGFDRAAGYGLKYASAFGNTHLGFKGRQLNHAHTA